MPIKLIELIRVISLPNLGGTVDRNIEGQVY